MTQPSITRTSSEQPSSEQPSSARPSTDQAATRQTSATPAPTPPPADVLNEEYTIDTPENVSIGYQVAGIGNRFIAALIDSAILGGSLLIAQILLLVTLAVLGEAAILFDDDTADWRQGLIVALFAIGTFVLIWGYFIFFEWFWNGQTPGKRMGKIRVVRMDGSPPRFLDIAVRNLIRIIDFMPFGYGIGLVTMFFNRHARRLGDIAAGVMVVKDRGELRLEDVTSPFTQPAPRPEPIRQTRPPDRPEPDTAESDTSESNTASIGTLAAGTQTHSAAQVSTQTPHAPTPPEDPTLRFPLLRRLRVADYELMQESLRRHDAGTLDTTILTRLAQAMTQKVGGHAETSVNWSQSRRRLLEIMDAYRRYHE